MLRTSNLYRLLGTGLIALSALLVDSSALAQEPKENTPPAPAAEIQPAPATKSVFRRRLPNYYAKVVDAKQREAIYKIQKEYFDKIAALQAQLVAIITERDQKVGAVLSPEQTKTVEQLQADAKAKREKKAEEKKPSDDQ